MFNAMPFDSSANNFEEIRVVDMRYKNSSENNENVDSILSLIDNLEQSAENLTFTENPDQNAIKELRKMAVQLANLGAMTASADELDELNRDIVDLFVEDVEEAFEWYGSSFLMPQGCTPVFGLWRNDDFIFQAGLWKKVKRAAHKVGKFIKKHKKEIIIGAAAAVAIGAAAFIVVEVVGSATAAAAAGAAAASAAPPSDKGNKSESVEKEKPREKISASAPNNLGESKSSHSHKTTRNDVVEAALERGERIAREQRYSNLVFSQEEVEYAKMRAESEWNQFTGHMSHELAEHWLDHTVEASEVIVGLSTAAHLGPTCGGVVAVLAAIKGASDFISAQKENIEKLYQPVGEAYKELHLMEEANKIASCDQCDRESYQPHLQFHPNPSQADPGKSSLVDLNNPNTHEIVVVLP